MECKDILNLIAIIVIPIVAVLIGQHLQNRAEIRKDKIHIFKVLMTSRIYGWTQESVHCLNIFDIVFSDDKKVVMPGKIYMTNIALRTQMKCNSKKFRTLNINCWKQ